jgi:hypothetical protein
MARSAQPDLSGTWLGDDGALYHLRHIGRTLWWAGLSVSSPLGAGDLHAGVAFTNVFRGRLAGGFVVGEWVDTPRGDIFQSGVMDLRIDSPNEIHRLRETGGFGGADWRRLENPPGDLADRMRAALEHGSALVDVCAVVHGTVVNGLVPVASLGDLEFRLRVDPSVLSQPLLPLGSVVTCRIAERGAHPILPGWRKNDANSVLFLNRRPINGDLRQAGDGTIRMLDTPLLPGTRVRVTGALTTDSGGAFSVVPVYVVDVQQHTPRTTLTGVWASNDGGTYYLHQRGDALWWLGFSANWGTTYTTAFTGTVRQRGAELAVDGSWADLPLGRRRGAGTVVLTSSGYSVLATEPGSDIGPSRWEKLSDTFTQT